jgi:hypothetical protein
MRRIYILLIVVLLVFNIPIVYSLTDCINIDLNSCEEKSPDLKYDSYRIDHNTMGIYLDFRNIDSDFTVSLEEDSYSKEIDVTPSNRVHYLERSFSPGEHSPNMSVELSAENVVLNFPKFTSYDESVEVESQEAIYSANIKAKIIPKSRDVDPIESKSYMNRFADGDYRLEVLEDISIPPENPKGDVIGFKYITSENYDQPMVIDANGNNETRVGFVVYSPEPSKEARLVYNYTLSNRFENNLAEANINVVDTTGDDLDSSSTLNQNEVELDLVNSSVVSNDNIFEGDIELSEKEVKFMNERNRFYITIESDSATSIGIYNMSVVTTPE